MSEAKAAARGPARPANGRRAGPRVRYAHAGLAGWARAHWAPVAATAAYVAATYLTTGTICLVYATTGLPCPGCGSARALAALLRGDIAGAHRMHPLILLSMAILAAAMLDALAPAVRAGLIWMGAARAGAAQNRAGATQDRPGAILAGAAQVAPHEAPRQPVPWAGQEAPPQRPLAEATQEAPACKAPPEAGQEAPACKAPPEAGQEAIPEAPQEAHAHKAHAEAGQKAPPTEAAPPRRLSAKLPPKALRRALIGIIILYVAVYAARMFLMFPDTPPMSVNENALGRRLYRLATEMPIMAQ